MRRLLTAAILLTAGLTGCIGEDADELEPTGREAAAQAVWADRALPFGPGHDHEDPAHHEGLSTSNFELVGYTPLNSSFYGGQPAGAYFCGDAQATEDGRRLAVVESRSQVGFALADVTDPAEPEWLGELVMRTTRIYDLAVVPDGQHVVLATSGFRYDLLDELPGADGARSYEGLTWRSACTDGPVPLAVAQGALQAEDPVPRPMSVLLVDISDPSEPTIVDHQPLAGNGHSVFTTRIDGTDWAMVTTTRAPGPIFAPGVDENGVSFYEFLRVTDGPTGERLELVSTWKRMPSEEDSEEQPQLGPRGHDGWMAEHPGTGELTAYLAGGDRVTLLDMSDPSNPSELGRWTVKGPGTPAREGTLHSVYPLPELWNGTHYTIVGPEHAGHPDGYPSGIIWVLDTTDPAEPTPVAAWTLPHEVDWSGTFMFSNHYLSVVDQTLFVSMYHGGIWAVDLSELADGEAGGDGLLSLDSIGVFVGSLTPPAEPADPERWAPTFEEVLAMPDGSLVTFDGNAGLYTLGFDASEPMPAPEPWPIPAES